MQKTIRDYLKNGVMDILQEGFKGEVAQQIFNPETMLNNGLKNIREAVCLLGKRYPLDTEPAALIKSWGGLENVPDYHDSLDIEDIPVEQVDKKPGDFWYKDKKKVMIFVCAWNDKRVGKPIDYLPRIPHESDVLDLGIILWEGEELKDTYLPGHPKSLYYVNRVLLARGHVMVYVMKFEDYEREIKKMNQPVKRR